MSSKNIRVCLNIHIGEYYVYSNIDDKNCNLDYLNNVPSRYYIYVSEDGSSLHCHYYDNMFLPQRYLMMHLSRNAHHTFRDIAIKLKFKRDDISEIRIDDIIFRKKYE